MEAFPSNTHKSQEQKKTKAPVEKNIEKVTTGQVLQRKKSLGERFKGVFFGGEIKGATRYITSEVLLPAMKNLIVEATSKGVERMIYGDSAPRRRGMVDPRQTRVSYNSPIDRRFGGRPTMLPDQPPRYGTQRRQSIGDIIISSRAEAETVVERLQDIVSTYDVASIADLYELCGLPSTYIDNQWGWLNLAYVDVVQTRDGYIINLPPAEAIQQ
jgi:hypothetical protein